MEFSQVHIKHELRLQIAILVLEIHILIGV